MTRTRAAALLCLLVAISGCVTSTAEPSHRTPPLPDGFHAPAGTTRVGPVIPELVGVTSGGVAVARHRAWTAILQIRGDARGVYAALAQPAKRAGFVDLPPADRACASEPDVDVEHSGPAENGFRVLTCRAASSRGDVTGAPGTRRVELLVVSCRACRPEIDVAQIHFDAGEGSTPTAKIVPVPVPTPASSLEGHPEWTALPGTRVLTNARYAGPGCEASQLVVLAVDDADRTWRSVLRHLPGVRIVASTTGSGRRFRQAIASDGPSQQLVSMADATRHEPAVFTMSSCEG